MIKPLGIGAGLMILASAGYSQSPANTPVTFNNILDNSAYVGKPCTNYNVGYFNAITGDIIRCTNTVGFNLSLTGTWVTVSGGGGGGSAVWGGISGTLSNQGDLAAALNAKQNTLTLPLSVANGGNGTATPAITAGANVSVAGSWPNYTISSTGGGGGGVAWGGITGTLSAQADLQTALNAKQNTLTLPLSVANGGTGTATPGLTAGANISITGSWPNQTVAASGGGGGGIASGTSLPGTCVPGTDTLFFKTNGAPNQQVYTCSATNTWTLNLLLGGLGALAVDGTTGALDIVPTVVPRVSQTNIFTGRNTFATVQDFTMIATPAAAAAGKLGLYANSDGSLHYINAAGTDAALATGAGFANPMTTVDDVIVGGASGVPARLAKGADSQVLGVDPGTHHLAYLNQSGGSTPFNGGLITTELQISGPLASPMLAIGNTDNSAPTFMYFDGTSRQYSVGTANSAGTTPGTAPGHFFIFDDQSTSTIFDVDPTATTPITSFKGTIRIIPQTTSPPCSATGDIGKIWLDNTTTTTAYNVCLNVAGTVQWVTK